MKIPSHRTRAIAIVLVFALGGVVTWRRSHAPPVKKSTPDQVIAVARKFCVSIGQPATGTPTLLFPAPVGHGWPTPQWEVIFNDAHVQIVDGAAIVTSYDCLAGQSVGPAGRALPKSTALKAFSKVVAASGLPAAEVGAPDVTENQGDFPATQDDHQWFAVANRKFHGADYYDQTISVFTQAETGRISTLLVDFPTPAPARGVQSIPVKQAITLANAVVRGAGVPNLVLGSSTLQVVQPNDLFQSGIFANVYSHSPRMAWNCFYSDGHGSIVSVWIDTETGDVLGGERLEESN